MASFSSLPHDIQREISKHLSVANKIRLGAASKRGAKNNNIAGPGQSNT